MKKALSVSVEEDLRPFSRHLHELHILHRISEQSGVQIIWVGKAEDVPRVRKAYESFQPHTMPAGDRKTPERIKHYDSVSWQHIWQQMLHAPVTSMLILLSLLFTLILHSQFSEKVFLWLPMDDLSFVLESLQIWRLITPIFLHFSLLHLAFNMLMLWVFGHLVERRESTGTVVTLVLLFAVFSNLAQYTVSGGVFGGMSGVVYGVLAFCWQWDRVNPERAYGFPPALMGFMMFWLVLGYTDVLALVGFGRMANTAHFTGLVCGIISAFAITLIRTPGKKHTNK